jgi:ribonucleotide reductase alpha subunit
VPAIELWKSMLKMLFETGHPWITFKDPCNLRSPQDHAGVIHSSNLCTEITLNTGDNETAVCNLGSVVLDTHVSDDGAIDHEEAGETIRVAIRALDNVIDINFYPTEAARNANQRHRPIGMGVMGLQNSLLPAGTPSPVEEAVEFNDEFMEAIAYYAYEASSDLAGERGTYSSLQGIQVGPRDCCPRIPWTCSKRNGASRSRCRGVAKWTGAGARQDRPPGDAQPTCWPSLPPPPSPISWAPALHRADLQEPLR